MGRDLGRRDGGDIDGVFLAAVRDVCGEMGRCDGRDYKGRSCR